MTLDQLLYDKFTREFKSKSCVPPPYISERRQGGAEASEPSAGTGEDTLTDTAQPATVPRPLCRRRRKKTFAGAGESSLQGSSGGE